MQPCAPPPAFRLDSRLETSSHPLLELPLCAARLQADTRFPWLVLVPRRPDLTEIADLDPKAQRQLWSEVLAAGEAVRALAALHGVAKVKLNHGQLGNVVPQLHVHVVARWEHDPAWPGPVWGFGSPRPYPAARLAVDLRTAAAALRDRLRL